MVGNELASGQAIRLADAQDVEQIARLVNQAYRPEGTACGWTHEAALVAGARISIGQVSASLHPGSSILLMQQDSHIVGCVHVEQEGNICHIGMLAILPACQNQGMGKQLLAAAERWAIQHHAAQVLTMSVLSSRPELLAYYERRGYKLSGHVTPYPIDAGVGVPQRDDLCVMEMLKSV